MNKRSLSFSLSVWSTLLVTGFLAVFWLTVYFGLGRYLVATVRQSLRGDAEAIGAELAQSVDEKGEAYITEELTRRYSSRAEDRFIRVLRANGSVLYESSPRKYGDFDPSRVPLSGQHAASPFSSEVYLPDHHRLLTEGLSVTTPKGNVYLIETGCLYLYIEGVLDGVLIAMSIIMPFFIASAAAGSWILTRRALKPVDEITQHAEHITSSSLSGRLPIIKTGDQLERLSVSLNKMIGRLESAFFHVNRFSADVSHELRTPLTILRGELEGLAQHPKLAPHLLDHLSSALDETDQLTRIVDHLLTLARLDSDAFMNRTPICLNAIVETTTEQMKLLAKEKDISIHLQSSERVEIEGDAVRIAQVVANLLDNAIKYTEEGGRITVRVSKESDTARFEVADTGIGIAAHALPHLFERFYRADKSRSRSSGGAGLGLAIVKAICTAHQGDVSIASLEGSGTRVTVSLPAIYSVASDPLPAAVGRAKVFD
jgi:heavy metal sensor kinase